MFKLGQQKELPSENQSILYVCQQFGRKKRAVKSELKYVMDIIYIYKLVASRADRFPVNYELIFYYNPPSCLVVNISSKERGVR